MNNERMKLLGKINRNLEIEVNEFFYSMCTNIITFQYVDSKLFKIIGCIK